MKLEAGQSDAQTSLRDNNRLFIRSPALRSLKKRPDRRKEQREMGKGQSVTTNITTEVK